MTNQDAPDRIWIEEGDGCPYFYDASELAEAGGPLIEYIRADLATPAPVVPAEGLVEALRAQQPAAPVSGVTVKPLVWEDQPCGSYCWVQGLHYYTEGDDEDRDWYVSCMIYDEDVWQGENQATRDACKALAQADYEARILSALEGK